MPKSCLENYTLQGIKLDCNPLLAGIKRLWLTYYDDVTATPDFDTHQVSAVTLSSGVTWYKYDFARDTSSLTSTLTKDDSNGTRYYTNTITVVFNKLEAQKHLEVMALAAEKLAAIVEDMNNTKWFVGYDGYISASASETTTGASSDDRNGYNVTLDGTSAYLPFEFTGTIE